MASAQNQEIIDRFEEFYRSYYRDAIGELAQRYPNEERSLLIDWGDLYRFDQDLADDLRNQPSQLLQYAEEALRRYDLPADVSLGQAHLRISNLPETVSIRKIRARHVNTLVEVRGIIRKATDVRPKIQSAAFECQRCGTLTRIPQTSGAFQEPHECQGCERQGPFRINFDQSEFIDAQKLRIQESPEGLRGGETPQSIDVHIEDDITGRVTAGDHVKATGILHLEQQGSEREKSTMFDIFMEGVALEVEDEQFEEMDITDEDKQAIVELSNESEIYDKMVKSIAPTIYGHDRAKLAMALQLFSGVTKHLPDGSRTRGDLHMLLIGDPGTGKSQLLQYIRHIAPRSVYTSGKGSSAAGLTAAAVRDDFGDGNQWTLEAGAMVLADQGIAAIDELDKMRCVSGDTLVQLGDGRVSRIRDIAIDAARSGETERLKNGRTIRDIDIDVWTVTQNGRIVRRSVEAIHEYSAPDKLKNIRLESGEVITTTEDHPFIIAKKGDRIKKPASKLNAGDWVMVPKRITSPISDGGTAVDSSSYPATDYPSDRISPALGAILGYISGDGNIYYNRQEGVYGVRFTNKEEELLADFERVSREEFNKDPVRPPSEKREDGVEVVRLIGKRYADAILEAGMNLRTFDQKGFPSGISTASLKTKASFIRALADSEGCVDVISNNMRIFSSSYELLLGVKLLLLEFGISSQIHHREGKSGGRDLYILAITSAKSLQRYNRHIGFTLDRKQSRLEQVTKSVSGDRTIIDVIPECGDLLKEIRTNLRLYQSECGLCDVKYCNFENNDANISLRLAEIVLDQFEGRIKSAEKDLKLLSHPVDWPTLHRLKSKYHISQSEIAKASQFTQPYISENWGEDEHLKETVQSQLTTVITGASNTDLTSFRNLVQGDVKWRRVKSVETARSDIDDDRIDFLIGKITDLIECEYDNAIEYAHEICATDLRPKTWKDIQAECDRFGVSQNELAEGLDVAGATVSRWINGIVETDSFDKIAKSSTSIVGEKQHELRQILEEIESRTQPKVYDLTIEGTHNYIANGMVVHNSEDRSALHEALEQQSYHPRTEVLLADGRRVEIGRFVDEAMAERPEEIIDGVDCEILPVDNVKVHSVDMETNGVEKTPIDRVSRHKAPDEFVRVTFSNGRTVVVTPEHPMFVEDGGTIGTVEAKDIEEGAFVPAPRKLPNSAVTVALADERRVGKEKDVRLPSGMSPELAEILGLLTAEGHSYAGSAHEIEFSNQDERLLARIEDLMADVFGMRSSDTTNAAGTITKRWISTKLYRWFEANFPEFMHTARDKRIPAKVLGASEGEIRRFLVGAFAGDGGVESESMAFSTSSRGLADDYSDALLKIGIASRIHYNKTEDSWKTYVMDDSFEIFVKQVIEPVDRRYEKARAFVDRGKRTKRHHDVLGTSAAREIRELRRLLGLSLTGEFRPHLDEGYGVRIETVQQHLRDLRRRSNEIYHRLEEATTLSEIRSLIGWSGRELAERLENIPTWRIHYAEKEGYDDETRRRLSEHVRSAILAALDEFERRADELEDQTDIRYYRVKDVEIVPNAGEFETDWVYDVTVEPSNTFVSQGVILHNSISISKAGINATLKSRCSLLGAANPKYGRFDQYESIGEQIDLEPALISRFDLIFTMSDLPDPEDDRRLAEHILRTNYAGELNTQLEKFNATDITQEEIDAVSEQVAPAIDPDLLRKYVAYAKQNCYPRMSKEAMEAIQEFYVDLRSKGADEDAPVPVTARKLEALVRLSEASARVRLADTVTREDAERVIEIVRACLQDIGVDPETGEYDVDVIETGRSKTQRDRMKGLKGIIRELQDEHDDGAPVDEVLEQAEAAGIERSKAEHEIQKLRDKGEIYSPNQDHLRVV